MDNLEVYMDLSPVDFPNICRICLNNGDLKPFEESLTKIFMNLTNIEVHPEDNLPSNICIECTSKLRDISNFIDSSKINDSGLRRLLNSEKQSYFEDSLEEPTDRESVCYENDIEVETNETEDENDSDNQQCHKCVLCGEVFSTEEELASHKKGNSACSQKKIKCSHCKKTFTTKNRLNVHMAVHSDERRYECKLCGKKFTFSRNLLRHDNSVHKKLKPFKCELCGKDNLDQHPQIQESNLPQHLTQKAYNEAHSKKDLAASTTPCPPRGISFKNMRSLKQHKELREPYRCELHSQTYDLEKTVLISTMEASLNKHLLRHHAPSQSHLCRICQKQWSSKCSLHLHSCFHSKQTLFTHHKPSQASIFNKNHHATTDFLCTVCGKKFAKKSLLDVHSRVHTGVKPYECATCGKKFSQHSSLAKHIKSHTGERNFPCSLCEKAFKQSQHLKSHVMLKHTKEKPHACGFCGKRFTLASTMRVHARTHTGEKPYSCSVCGNRFSDSSAMRRHQRVHSAA